MGRGIGASDTVITPCQKYDIRTRHYKTEKGIFPPLILIG